MDGTGADSSHAARLDAVATRLEDRARLLERRRDSRCVFTTGYAIMTRRVADELATAGLADPEWVVAIAEAFSERYFLALDTYDGGGDVPPAWRAVFDALAARRTSVLEDLVFGVYAHIVRDLPHTLAQRGFADAEGRSRIGDHHVVTGIVGRAIDDIQDAVATRYGPYIRSLDRIGKRYDEILTDYGIRLSRGMAWYNGLRLADPASAEAAAAALERSTAVFVEHVIDPPFWSARAARRALRRLAAHLRRWPESDPAQRS
jgi:Family of unknown function (DUF5995)